MNWTESIPVVMVGIVALAGLLLDIVLRSEAGRRGLQQAVGHWRSVEIPTAADLPQKAPVRQRRFTGHSVGLAGDLRHARRSRRLVA